MTNETGWHYNELRCRARPATFSKGRYGYAIQAHNEETTKLLESRAVEILKKRLPDLTAARLRRAADKNADFIAPSLPHSTGYVTYSDDVYEAIKGEVEAMLDAHNTTTLAEYEAYRLACVQGVATPPNKDTK